MKFLYVLGALFYPILILPYYGKQNLAELALTVAVGPMAMGFVVAALSWIAGNKLNNSFIWKVLCISLTLLLAWLLLILPTNLGFGESLIEQLVVISLLLLSVVVGFTYGNITWRRRNVVDDITAFACQASFSREAGSDPRIATGLIRAMPGLLWFVLGLLLAVGITFFAGWISFEFVDRGPVIWRGEWGGETHKYDRIVNAATGLVIAVFGWVMGLSGWRRHLPRPLIIGIILGATLLGVFWTLNW